MNTNEKELLWENCHEIAMLHFALKMKNVNHEFKILEDKIHDDGYQIILKDEIGKVSITQRSGGPLIVCDYDLKHSPKTIPLKTALSMLQEVWI